jgi:acyl-CoA dehydrogenase
MIAEQLARLLRAGGGFAAMAELGLPRALAEGLSFAEIVPLWRLLGRHASAAPLGEAMLAEAWMGEAGLPPQEAVVLCAESLASVPFGRMAGAVLTATGDALILHQAQLRQAGGNLAGDPRDAMAEAPIARAALDHAARRIRLGLALLRAAQMAGAAETALELSLEWANTRRQFGRSIGKFQAVQQSLAQMAAEAAAMEVALAAAARAADARGLPGAAFEIGCAKLMAGEGGTRIAAGAHQIFAAMGMTEEHALQRFTRRLWAWRDEAGSEREWATELGEFAMAQGARFWVALTERDLHG